MSKIDDLKEIVRYVVDSHEWCEMPPGPGCKSCDRPTYACNDSGKCSGCKMRTKAKRLLGKKP